MSFFKTTLASMLGFLLGGFLIFLMFMLLIAAIVSSASQGKEVSVKDNSILHFKLSGTISERGTVPFEFNSGLPFLDDLSKLGLYELREVLRKAAKDDRIKGILFEPSALDAGWATVESLRRGMEEFKASGKFVYAYSEFFTEKTWYLATVADEVWIHPYGMLEFNGLASNPMFYKNMMDKLGVKAQVFRVGTFKSAVEPFIQDKMSEANRLQIQTLLDDAWGHFIDKSAATLKVSPGELDTLASLNSIARAQDAVKAGLVKGIAYRDGVMETLKTKLGKEKTSDLTFITLKDYLIDYQKHPDGMKHLDKQIAVIFASGEIVDGKGDGDNIGGESLAEELKKARENDKIKAVVLRVNSPGGSGLASDVIHREVQLLKKVKPVIVSMGDLAASGGYYISAPADHIFAEPNTITGSIGVFGLMLNTENLFEDKVGITFDRVTTNPYADIGNPNREMTEAEKAHIQGMVNEFYGRFIHIVQEGRNYPDSVTVDKLAQGRVWTGMRAKEIGLVDELGGLDEAVKYAANKAGLGDTWSVKALPEEGDAIDKILKSLGIETMEQLRTLNGFEAEMRTVRRIKKMMSRTGVLMRMPMDIEMN